MASIYGVHHICINTPDIDKSLIFYLDVIGCKLLSRECCAFGEYAMLRMENNDLLELIQPKEQNENTFGAKGSIAHIGLGVKDIYEVVKNLRAKGVEFETEDVMDLDEPMGGLYAITFYGPSQEQINLYEFKNEF